MAAQDRRPRETEAGAVETTDILLTYSVPEAWDSDEGGVQGMASLTD